MSSSGGRMTTIERIDNEGARNVCFSKRRAGLFKKASELALLCRAESVLVVYSPAGNPYSFGSPRVKEVADRFLLGNAAPADPSVPGGHEASAIQHLSTECSRLSSQIWMEAERKQLLVDSLNSMVQENHSFQFVNGVEGLGLEQLKQLKNSLDLLRARTHMRMSEILMRGGAWSLDVAMTAENQFEAGDRHAHQGGPRFY